MPSTGFMKHIDKVRAYWAANPEATRKEVMAFFKANGEASAQTVEKVYHEVFRYPFYAEYEGPKKPNQIAREYLVQYPTLSNIEIADLIAIKGISPNLVRVERFHMKHRGKAKELVASCDEPCSEPGQQIVDLPAALQQMRKDLSKCYQQHRQQLATAKGIAAQQLVTLDSYYNLLVTYISNLKD